MDIKKTLSNFYSSVDEGTELQDKAVTKFVEDTKIDRLSSDKLAQISRRIKKIVTRAAQMEVAGESIQSLKEFNKRVNKACIQKGRVVTDTQVQEDQAQKERVDRAYRNALSGAADCIDLQEADNKNQKKELLFFKNREKFQKVPLRVLTKEEQTLLLNEYERLEILGKIVVALPKENPIYAEIDKEFNKSPWLQEHGKEDYLIGFVLVTRIEKRASGPLKKAIEEIIESLKAASSRPKDKEYKPDLASKKPHKVLGLSKQATQEEIRKKYRALSLIHHPDKGGKKEDFQAIQAAFEQLTR